MPCVYAYFPLVWLITVYQLLARPWEAKTHLCKPNPNPEFVAPDICHAIVAPLSDKHPAASNAAAKHKKKKIFNFNV